MYWLEFKLFVHYTTRIFAKQSIQFQRTKIKLFIHERFLLWNHWVRLYLKDSACSDFSHNLQSEFVVTYLEVKLATYQFEYYVLAYWGTRSTLSWMWQSGRGMVRSLLRICKRVTAILKIMLSSHCCTASEWDLASISSSTFPF